MKQFAKGRIMSRSAAFFASAVKPHAVAASHGLLRQARREIAVPLVAIGGITAQNGAQLLEAGADALAVISAVFGAADIQDAARQFANLNYPEHSPTDGTKQHDFT